MKHFRIKVRDEKADFFEELLRYLDFLDYEQVDAFSEPRIYANFNLRPGEKKSPPKGKMKDFSEGVKRASDSSTDDLREVLSRIDKLRENIHK